MVKTTLCLAALCGFACAALCPLATVNITLPQLASLPLPLPPLLGVSLLWQPGNPSREVAAIENTLGDLLYLDSDEIRFNESAIAATSNMKPGHHRVALSCGTTLHVTLSDSPLNCTALLDQLCFWEDVEYQVPENHEPADLGFLSSQFLSKLCPNYSVTYHVPRGNDVVEVSRRSNTNLESWRLSSRHALDREAGERVVFSVVCVVGGGGATATLQRDMTLLVLDEDDSAPTAHFVVDYTIRGDNIVGKGERVGVGVVADRDSGRVNNLFVSVVNDTSNGLGANCSTADPARPDTHIDCDIYTRKELHLDAPYVAFVEVVDRTLSGSSGNKITSKLELVPRRLFSSSSVHVSGDTGVQFPDEVTVSRFSVVATRVARALEYPLRIKFDVKQERGPFNITEEGGIVFVAHPELLKNLTEYQLNISWSHPGTSEVFFHTLLVRIADTANTPCSRLSKPLPSCSERRTADSCLKTCGWGSGALEPDSNDTWRTVGCQWRSNPDMFLLSRNYTTCTPALTTCPDRYCDPLESLFPKVCPQDCADIVLGAAMKNDKSSRGIASATGVCYCHTAGSCMCNSDRSRGRVKGDKKSSSTSTTALPTIPSDVNVRVVAADEVCGLLCMTLIVGGSSILILLLIGIRIAIKYRRLQKRCPKPRHSLKEDRNMNYEEYMDRPLQINQQAEVCEKPEYYDKKWEFPRSRLLIGSVVGEGEFGRVLKARAEGIGEREGQSVVAVKTLKDNAREIELSDLISEYQLLKEVDHPNVIKLLGACTTTDGPVYIIIEYAQHGSLWNHLRKSRRMGVEQVDDKEGETSYVESITPITPKDILTFGWQIAKGMAYLTEMKLVHRDLAARNVLLAKGLICKISDFGLTRDIYEDDTYVKRSRTRVPAKWMALESLADQVYTQKSDVWSYGVVLWELVTTGASPYPGVPVQDLFRLLNNGYRMARPPNCSQELYLILRSCWHKNPALRPTFKTLVAKLEEMLSKGKEYLDLNPRIIENKTYFSDFSNETDEEKQLFLPVTDEPGVMQWRFELTEGTEQTLVCSCPPLKCVCNVTLRYENEAVSAKPRYENETATESYVAPSGEPKPVNVAPPPPVKAITEMIALQNSNLYVETNKGELFEVKKI